MQRERRSTAGNIYLKRREEIRTEANKFHESSNSKVFKKRKTSSSSSTLQSPPTSPSKSPPTKKRPDNNLDNKSNKSGTPVKRASSPTGSKHPNKLSKTDSDNTLSDLDDDKDEGYEYEGVSYNKNTNKDETIKVNKKSTSLKRKYRSRSQKKSKKRSGKANDAKSKPQRSSKSWSETIANVQRFKCPLCRASFSLERYVEFHCKAAHNHIYQLKDTAASNDKVIEKIKVEKRDDEKSDTDALIIKEEDNNQDSLYSGHFLLKNDKANEKSDFASDDEGQEVESIKFEENMENYYTQIQGDNELGAPKYECTFCDNFSVTSKHVLFNHIQRHLDKIQRESEFPCEFCEFRGKTQKILTNHTSLVHSSEQRAFICKVCTMDFTTADSLIQHTASHHSYLNNRNFEENKNYKRGSLRDMSKSAVDCNKNHKCPYCDDVFMSRINLKTHINIHKLKEDVKDLEIEDDDDEDYYPEKEMQEKKNAAVLSRLMSSKYSVQKKYPAASGCIGKAHCDTCDLTFLNKEVYERHKTEVHDKTKTTTDTTVTCKPSTSQIPPTINIDTSTQKVIYLKDLQFDSTLLKRPMKFKCSYCSILLDDKNSILEHIKKNHNRLPIPKLSFNSSTGGVKNMPTILNRTETKTVGQISANNVASSAQSQISIINGEDSIPTHRFPSQEASEQYLKLTAPGTSVSYGADKEHVEYTCGTCHLTILGYQESAKHLQTHALPGLACHLCDKKFASKASLCVHYLIHIGISFTCQICGKKLSKKKSLVEHLRYHMNERRHICRLCGKAFITTSSLNRHVKGHSAGTTSKNPVEANATSFSCPYCPAKFVVRGDLTNHIKAHEIINQYNPTATNDIETQVSFEGSSGLLDSAPMSCSYCGKMWASAVGLSRHIKAQHSEIIVEEVTIVEDVTASQVIDEEDNKINVASDNMDEDKSTAVTEGDFIEEVEYEVMGIIDSTDIGEENGLVLEYESFSEGVAQVEKVTVDEIQCEDNAEIKIMTSEN